MYKVSEILNKEVHLRINNSNLITGKVKRYGRIPGKLEVDKAVFDINDVTAIVENDGKMYIFVYTNVLG